MPLIEPGLKSQVRWDSGAWIFLDVGFSSSLRSCGFACGEEEPRDLRFGDARREILECVAKSDSTINLLIEAPLSVCFDSKGNPKGRRVEREGGKIRYWYSGPGCSVMVAAMYLIRDIDRTYPDAHVRLFEGFVSYKERNSRSSHADDVRQLRDVVKNPIRFSNCILSPDELKSEPTDLSCSAFPLRESDCGVPVVIRPRVGSRASS